MKKLIAFLIALLIYGGTNYYIGSRLYHWLLPDINGVVFTIVYCLIALSIFMVFIPLPKIIKNIGDGIGSYWMGIFIYLFLFFLLVDILLLVARLFHIVSSPITDTIKFYSGLLVIVLTVIVVGYGIYNAKKIKHVSYHIQIRQTKHAVNMNLVFISDLHLGAVHSEKRLPFIIKDINALKPDIVCIVGDIFNDDINAINNKDNVIQLLKSISATYGVYASLGNHDGGRTFNQMLDLLKQSNIQLLHDEYVIIDERLILFGRLDPSPIGGFGHWKRKDITYKMEELNKEMPIVIMDHTPSNLGQYGNDVDLVLAGHTHKGQMFPGSMITSLMFEVDYGYYQRDLNSPHVVVSSGVGTWGMPMRVGTQNEIVTIRLK